MDDQTFATVDRIRACRTVAAVGEAFAEGIAPHGFDASACGAFLTTDTGPETSFFFQSWPADWIKTYMEGNFVAHDFSVAEARRRLFPFTWLEVKEERVLSQGEIRIWEAANARGWRNGMTVPIHGPGGYLGIVAMAGAAKEIEPNVRLRLHLMSLVVHETCRQLQGIPLVSHDGEPLSARELECLRWVAAGKSDGEIATILGLSPTTVKFHVDNARQKLGVRTRAQAVARLVLSGLS